LNGGKMMKKIWSSLLLIILLSSITLLGACGSGGAKANQADLSTYPESVQDGTVSVEYYEQLTNYIRKSNEYTQTTTDILAMGTKYGMQVTGNNEYQETFKEVLHSHYELIQNLKVKPSTKADKEIDNILSPIVNNQLKINLILLEHIETSNIELIKDAVQHMKNNEVSAISLNSAIDKYSLIK
jgi:hypothetical protein